MFNTMIGTEAPAADLDEYSDDLAQAYQPTGDEDAVESGNIGHNPFEPALIIGVEAYSGANPATLIEGEHDFGCGAALRSDRRGIRG